MLVHDNKIVTLSSGSITRVWSSFDGESIWDDGHYSSHPTIGEHIGNADIQLVNVEDELCVLTLTETGEIRLRSLNKGLEMWSLDHKDHHPVPARAITVDVEHEYIFTVAFPTDSRHMKLTIFQLQTGKTVKSHAYELRDEISMDTVLIKGEYVVMLNKNQFGETEIDVLHLEADFHSVPKHFKQEDFHNYNKVRLVDLPKTAFSLASEEKTIVYELDGSASEQNVHIHP
eukprot:UN23907